jgi:UDP-N-acetyl-D-glucosamine dehydrogenase
MYIKITTALNKHKKAVNGSNILFLGAAYKPNIDDARESPALEIIDEVIQKGGIVSYNDPFIPNIKTHNNHTLNSIELSKENLMNADVVVITTNHSAYDSNFILEHSKLIVDLRNMFDKNDKTYKL